MSIPPATTPLILPTRGSIEEWIGKRWTTWVGALALVIAVAMFVDLAMERGWLGPTARTVLAALAGGALVVAGERARSRSMRALSHGLSGAGVAILYVAIAAGYAYYRLYEPGVAFALLVAITCGGMLLAVHHDAPAIAHVAILGGLLAPVMVVPGDAHRDALCVYLAVLDLGVLAVAFSKQWRALDALALIGTWSLFTAWYDPDVERGAATAVTATLAWSFVFLAIFVALPFVYHLRRRIAPDLARFLGALVSTAIMFGFAAHVLADSPHALGAVAAALAAGYLALGALVRVRVPTDELSTASFLACAAMFATIAVALELGAFATAIGWAAEGPVLVALGYRYRYAPARLAGALALAIAPFRLLGSGWPDRWGGTPFVNAGFATALAIAAAAALYAAIHHRNRDARDYGDRTLQLVAAIGAPIFTLVATHAELWRVLDVAAAPIAARLTVVVTWLVGALGFASVAGRIAGTPCRLAAVGCLAVAAAFMIGAFAALSPGPLVIVNARFMAAIETIATIYAVARAMARSPVAGERALAGWLRGATLVGLWLAVGAEAYQQFATAAETALTSAWAVYAVGLIAGGFAARRRRLRLAGLGVLGATAAKLLLVDLAQVDPLYRMLSFAVAGAVMIAVSYGYHRVDRRLAGVARE